MADDSNWYPGKNMVAWTKKTWKAHPALAGAVVAAGGVAAVVGTGGLAAPLVILGAAGAGASLSSAIAKDGEDKKS